MRLQAYNRNERNKKSSKFSIGPKRNAAGMSILSSESHSSPLSVSSSSSSSTDSDNSAEMPQEPERDAKPSIMSIRRQFVGLLREDELDEALEIVFRKFPDVLQGSPPFRDVLSIVSGGALYVYFAREARRKRVRRDGSGIAMTPGVGVTVDEGANMIGGQ